MYNSASSKATAASNDKHTSPKSSSNSIEKKNRNLNRKAKWRSENQNV